MDLGLRDRVIMVAAASQGLSFSIGRAVALEGARVSIALPTETRIHEAASKLREESGSKDIPCVFDVGDSDSIFA